MFRLVLISSLLAISLAATVNLRLPNLVPAVTNDLPDFSDITDNITDIVKARFDDLVSKGLGRHVQELIGIQKKLKIINKIAAEQVKKANANSGRFGAIAHEIFHAFGVFHHHSRSDRDTYLTLSAANQDDNQFTKLTTSDSYNYGTMYDYGSVMHYGLDGMTAVETLYQSTMGAGLGPQFGDIVLINTQYQCMCKSATVTCANGGYPNPNGCSTCLCRGGFGGSDCSVRDPGTENPDVGVTLQAIASDSCQTLVTSLGNDDGVINLYYQKSWFWIQAPAGKQVQLIFQKAGTSPGVSYSQGYGCTDQGVEIKLKNGEFNRTGTLFCGDDPALVSTPSNIIPFTSDSELAILQVYSQTNKFNLQVKYRYVDSTTLSTIPGSCQPCLDQYSNCNTFTSDVCANNQNIASGCPVTCGTCPK
uniref:Metalloendopeptidase n=1 Tax=Acrobeloides nanus TaxID=290746 RepID=A0A914EER5_9BILA